MNETENTKQESKTTDIRDRKDKWSKTQDIKARQIIEKS